ncbi:MAG TPA: HAD hydrolase-like protein, partial [Anaerolineales bacterium]
VVGKPSPYMARAILDLLGLAPQACLMTGDRLETDVRLGLDSGMQAAPALPGGRQEGLSEVDGAIQIEDIGIEKVVRYRMVHKQMVYVMIFIG